MSRKKKSFVSVVVGEIMTLLGMFSLQVFGMVKTVVVVIGAAVLSFIVFSRLGVVVFHHWLGWDKEASSGAGFFLFTLLFLGLLDATWKAYKGRVIVTRERGETSDYKEITGD